MKKFISNLLTIFVIIYTLSVIIYFTYKIYEDSIRNVQKQEQERLSSISSKREKEKALFREILSKDGNWKKFESKFRMSDSLRKTLIRKQVVDKIDTTLQPLIIYVLKENSATLNDTTNYLIDNKNDVNFQSYVSNLLKEKITPASTATFGYGNFILSNSVEENKIISWLGKHAFTENYAIKKAPKITKFIRGSIFKGISAFLAIIGGVYFLAQLFFELTFFEKLAIAISFFLILLLVYIKLKQKGITK